MKEFQHAALELAAYLMIAGVLTLGYRVFLDGQIINPVVTKMNFHTTKDVYHVGETIFVNIDVCKNRNASGNYQWTLSDGFLLPFEKQNTYLPIGCFKAVKEAVTIPVFVPPGKYHLTDVLTYEINPWNTVTYTTTTNEFEIR